MTEAADLKYTDNHQWVRTDPDGTVATGITEHAQQSLGDIVFFEAPAPAQSLQAGGCAGVLESVKTAADIYAPVSGTVTEINPKLELEPELINQNPYQTWLFKLKPDNQEDLQQLMDAVSYQAMIDAPQ